MTARIPRRQWRLPGSKSYGYAPAALAPGTVLVSDAFTRANGALGTAPTGQPWTVFESPPDETLRIDSNQLRGIGFWVAAVVNCGQTDFDAQVTITTIDALGTSGIMCDSAGSLPDDPTTLVYDYETSAYALAMPGTHDHTRTFAAAAPVAGDRLRLVRSGTVYTVSVNGASRGSYDPVADSHPLLAPYTSRVGVVVMGVEDATDRRLDLFSVAVP